MPRVSDARQPAAPAAPRAVAADEALLDWAGRAVWAVCIGVYLLVFVGGVRAGGDELMVLGRAAAFSLVAALLGRIVLGLLAGAKLAVGQDRTPAGQGQTAEPVGPVGSLVELLGSTNVGKQVEQAEVA